MLQTRWVPTQHISALLPITSETNGSQLPRVLSQLMASTTLHIRPTFSARACGDAAPLPVCAPPAALPMVLMLLASSRVNEFTLIFKADKLLAAPLPLPPLGGNPPNPEPEGPALESPAPPAAPAALDGPGPAALVYCAALLPGGCVWEPMGLSGLLLLTPAVALAIE